MMKNVFDNKSVLVTGGAGSIGSVIVKKLLAEYRPQQVRVFDQDEEAMFNISQEFASNPHIRFFMGDIRDKERIIWAMRDVDYVFHTAALKHVALSEYNPFEAIKTNVLGTENVVMAAIKNNVKKFINISTDKASIPFSTMGASKLLAERITAAANYYKGTGRTVCSSVRFGNVLASSGSVVPIFCNQIKLGKPITITDKRMIRFFMTINQAVELIFKATSIARGGEVFILKMPALRIIDLAQVLLEDYSVKLNRKTTDITIKEIGIRPGEKITEQLVTPLESEYTLEMKDMFVIPPIVENPDLKLQSINEKIDYYKSIGAHKIDKKSLKIPKLLTKDQIRKLLKDIQII